MLVNFTTTGPGMLSAFNILCTALGVIDDSQKFSMLFTYIGDDGYEIYENILPSTNADTPHTYNGVIEAFTNLFKPQVNTSYETYLFRKMNKQTNETIQQYYVHLHEQAAKCQFPDVDFAIKV